MFSFRLHGEPCAIGRSGKSDIVLPLPEVSRLHAIIEQRGKSLWILDHSRNGLLINGQRVRSSRVMPGDEVRIAAYRLRFGPREPGNASAAVSGTEAGSATLTTNTALPRSPSSKTASTPSSAAIDGLGEMIGASEPMQRVYAQVRRLTGRSEPVLILGETGTGKELVARALHHLGPARENPLVIVNCVALAPELVESELFGHEKDAFTGASRRRLGAFLSAQGGTLVLDEIGDMPPTLQAKLLRALESREILPVGSDTPLKVTARVLAATNRDLKKEVAAGRFRQDLYYRLRVAVITLPPLRERTGDPILLARRFLAEEDGGEMIDLTDDGVAFLESYRWPGNVRELRNLTRRLLAEGVRSPVSARALEQMLEADRDLEEQSLSWISSHSVSRRGTTSAHSNPPLAIRGEELRTARHDVEGRIVERMLEACNWNLSQAAKRLGVARGTLYKLIREHGLRRDLRI